VASASFKKPAIIFGWSRWFVAVCGWSHVARPRLVHRLSRTEKFDRHGNFRANFRRLMAPAAMAAEAGLPGGRIYFSGVLEALPGETNRNDMLMTDPDSKDASDERSRTAQLVRRSYPLD
jgi:hypothetical protein